MATHLSEIIYPELLTTQKLTSDAILNNKYMLWKLKLNFLLKDHKVDHILKTTNSNLNDPAWEKAEHVARYLILSRMDHLVFSRCHAKEHPTVKSMMEHLEKSHNGSVLLQTFLCGQYSGYRMEPGSDVNEHLFRMRAMAKLIEFSGVAMPEGVQALALLNSLPDEWEEEVERVMMEVQASKEALSFDNVGRRLRVANVFREWREYRYSGMAGGSKKRVNREKKTSTSNDDDDDDRTVYLDFAASLTEMIYSQLKTSLQLNYTGSYFCVWKCQIQSALEVNKVDYLLKDYVSPPEEDASSRVKRSSDDFIARHIILGGMSDDLFLSFHDYPTARALMDALDTWFGSPSVAQQMVEFSKYTRCQMPENRPVHKHLLDMDTMVNNLKTAGVEIPDEMQAPRLIDSLPGSWRDIQTTLNVSMCIPNDDTAEKSKLVDTVRSKIRSAGDLMEFSKQREYSERRSSRRFRGNCYSCGESGHYQSNCPYSSL